MERTQRQRQMRIIRIIPRVIIVVFELPIDPAVALGVTMGTKRNTVRRESEVVVSTRSFFFKL